MVIPPYPSLRQCGFLALLLLVSPRDGRAMRHTTVTATTLRPGSVLSFATAPQGPIVRGELTREIIRRVIYVHINEIRHCYQEELQMRPALTGRLVVNFWIDDRGQVHELRVQKTTMNLPSLLLCVGEAMQKWEFPATHNEGVTQVIYPFVMRPKPAEQPALGVQVSDEDLARLGVFKEEVGPAVDILF